MIDFDTLVVGVCTDTFGEPVLFQPRQGPAITIRAIFQGRQMETRFVGGDEVVDSRTILGCQASQFAAPPAHNDLLTLRGRLWRVREALDDAVGHIDLDIILADDMQANLDPVLPAYDR